MLAVSTDLNIKKPHCGADTAYRNSPWACTATFGSGSSLLGHLPLSPSPAQPPLPARVPAAALGC